MFPLRLTALSLTSLLLLFTGCGVTGGTTAKRATLAPEIANAALRHPVQCGTVELAPDAVQHKRIGTYNWGRFDAADLASFRRSLELSLTTSAATAPTAASTLTHVRLQHFACTFTNNRVAILAIADWSVANGSAVLQSEQFVAAYDTGDKLLNTETLGMVKTKVLVAMARRIAERSLAAANGLPMPSAPEYTYDTVAQGSANLPDVMIANTTGLVSTAFQSALGGLANVTELQPARRIAPLDWTAVLASR